MTRGVIIVFYILAISITCKGQIVTGRIVDNESKGPIKKAQVLNRDSLLTETNALGFFQINSLPGDSIRIRHTMYGERVVIIPNETKFTITLEKIDTIYLLDEISNHPEPEIGLENLGKEWFSHLEKNGGYPKEAKRAGIEGIVMINFIIDKNGEVGNSWVVSGIGYGCDEVAITSFRKIISKWTPGMRNGKKVKVIMNIPFKFRLQ